MTLRFRRIADMLVLRKTIYTGQYIEQYIEQYIRQYIRSHQSEI